MSKSFGTDVFTPPGQEQLDDSSDAEFWGNLANQIHLLTPLWADAVNALDTLCAFVSDARKELSPQGQEYVAAKLGISGAWFSKMGAYAGDPTWSLARQTGTLSGGNLAILDFAEDRLKKVLLRKHGILFDFDSHH